MRELLSLVPKPSRYLGIEEGTIIKNKASVAIHIALCFPDMYEVGMSYLGQKILYTALNARDDFWAERVYTPCKDTADILRQHDAHLATLESDTDLCDTDMVSFSITHELCYTNILYMLDLGGVPLRHKDRSESLAEDPIVIAGGGCTLGAEPITPFIDLMVLGEGEEIMVEVCALLKECKEQELTRSEYLRRAAMLPGIYVPSLFEFQEAKKPLRPLIDGYTPTRRVIPDMNEAVFPTTQPIPFGAVHSRLTIEMARGCTRGCRFCQAGMIYRPARERSVEEVERLLNEGLAETGYDEISFLALSSGDYSAMKTLFTRTVDRCSAEQISVSLPSLRVGSIDDEIMARMAGIRRTGATLAPEAGSQRMRDVINKGVTEEQVLLHVRKLFQHGWQQVKLYFMIGLPTETKDDLDAIVDLCLKVRDAAGHAKVKRLQVTAAISPFVPKTHTPFQWDKQISYDEIRERVFYLRDAIRQHKGITMRWHEPTMSMLEGIFSRGDRRLGDVIESAYKKGALFSSWVEHLSLDPYMEAMEEHGLTIEEYTRERAEDEALPWDHIHSGITKEFLLRERKRGLQLQLTEDCRYGKCSVCGVCDKGKKPSELQHLTEDMRYENKLNFPERDQQAHAPELDDDGEIVRATVSNKPPKLAEALVTKAGHYRVWYTKEEESVYLSQLELQSLFERMMRKAGLPMTFSQGFHPLPLISFGKALPVGVASKCEWMNIFLREEKTPQEVFTALVGQFPRGMQPIKVERLGMGKKQPQAISEEFTLRYIGDSARWEELKAAFSKFAACESKEWTRETKKGPRTIDMRPVFANITIQDDMTMHLHFDWSILYVSPLNLVRAVAPAFDVLDFSLTKTAQHMP